jgi:hypothetical protein
LLVTLATWVFESALLLAVQFASATVLALWFPMAGLASIWLLLDSLFAAGRPLATA